MKAVSMYPLLVSAVIVVPQYAGIYASFDAELPAPTLMVMKLSEILPLVALVVTAAIIAFIFWNKSKKDDLEIGERLDRIRFRMPLFCKPSKKLTLYRWSSTLAGTLGAGVLGPAALDLAGRSSGSRWCRATIPFLADAVRSGRPLSSEMGEFDDLYPHSCQSGNGANVWAFQPFATSSTRIATSCTWWTTIPFRTDEITEADVAFNTNRTWGHTVDDCTPQSRKYMISAAATHEAGHVFGFGHVADGTEQTMVSSTNTCSKAWLNLGRGDMRGAHEVYTP